MPMCDSDAAGSRPRRRSSALACTARRCAAADCPSGAGKVASAHAATAGSEAA